MEGAYRGAGQYSQRILHGAIGRLAVPCILRDKCPATPFPAETDSFLSR